MSTTEYKEIEIEVVYLRTITDLIDSMLNRCMLQVIGSNPDSYVLFHTAENQKFFNILLIDLISKSDSILVGKKVSYPNKLLEICKQPNFDNNGSIHNLRTAATIFYQYLKDIITIQIWLPSIDRELQLNLSRETLIRITGNISKHSLLRLSWVINQVKSLLDQAGISISMERALLATQEIYEKFHDDILNYQSSSIAEMLNNIQWGVYEYLLPEYTRCKDYDDVKVGLYNISYPEGIESELPKMLYLELMNWIRRKPYIPQFKVTNYLKKSY